MTLPTAADERRANLFNRANHFRRAGEFDKALAAYESILNDDNNDAEAHWGALISRYGVEYVEDPRTREMVPTLHRVQYESVLSDADYLSALNNAPDGYTRSLYERDATAIAEIQKGILAISREEKPFDVFICYKESSDSGSRTRDSALAQDIYYQLTEARYRVFFSRITLEDKLGQAYEPYIFSALNSAKVMLVIGTKPEHFNAVWVKNEWSRYLALLKKDRNRLLIPCYQDMDPYDLPEELSFLQSQDMSKIGFIQDLLRGVKKVLDAKAPETPGASLSATAAVAAAPGIESLYKRMKLFLEDGDFKQADEYCDRILDIDPEYAPAYIGKLCAELKLKKESELAQRGTPLTEYNNYQKAVRFANSELRGILSGYNDAIAERIEQERKAEQEREENERKAEQEWKENERKKKIYNQAVMLFERCKYLNSDDIEDFEDCFEDCEEAAQLFRSVSGFKDSDARADECDRFKTETINAALRNAYDNALKQGAKAKNSAALSATAEAFRKIGDYQDASAQAEHFAVRAAAARKKQIKVTAIIGSTAAVVIAAVIVVTQVIIPSVKYNAAQGLLDEGKYAKAAEAFQALGDYKDSYSMEKSARALAAKDEAYDEAEAFYDAGRYGPAALTFSSLGGYKDSEERALELRSAWVTELSQEKISASDQAYTVGLKSDGTVVATGYNGDGQCDVGGWRDIVSVSAGYDHTVGLKSDGTVVATGDNEDGQCDVGGWRDIASVSAGIGYTVGLRLDGTVVAVGHNYNGQCDVGSWRDIVSVSAGMGYTVGLKSDGTVVATGYNEDGQCDVGGWRDIISVSAGWQHTAGLKSDGTVVATGDNEYGQCDVGDWRDIVSVSTCWEGTVGLKSDGTLIAAWYWYSEDGQSDMSDWRDIVFVSVGDVHIVGLKSDGTVIAGGDNNEGQCDVQGWKLW
jgi:hypothetical protein